MPQMKLLQIFFSNSKRIIEGIYLNIWIQSMYALYYINLNKEFECPQILVSEWGSGNSSPWYWGMVVHKSQPEADLWEVWAGVWAASGRNAKRIRGLNGFHQKINLGTQPVVKFSESLRYLKAETESWGQRQVGRVEVLSGCSSSQ